MNRVKGYYKEEGLVEKLSKSITEYINKDLVVVNIGTDRCILDSLAPFVGTMLKDKEFSFPVYGTIDEPIHAKNLESRLDEIKIKHPNAMILGIDACLGKKENIGCVELRDDPICPGKGVGKTLPQVGEISLVGIVDDSNNSQIFAVNVGRISFVMNMAKVIVEALIMSEQKYINKIINNVENHCNMK